MNFGEMVKNPNCFFLSILLFFALSAKATTNIPYFIRNYSVGDYKASCQNWDISGSEKGVLYIANNSGLLAFNGNTWNIFPLPENEAITSIALINDTILTYGENHSGFWLPDEKGILRYHALDKQFHKLFNKKNPVLPFIVNKTIEEGHITDVVFSNEKYIVSTLLNGLYIVDSTGHILLHLSINNQLQDNSIHKIWLQDEQNIWLALDNGLSKITLNPPITLLAERSKVGKLLNGYLKGDELFIQTNKGFYHNLLGRGSPILQQISEVEGKKNIPSYNQDENLSIDELCNQKDLLGIFVTPDYISYVSPNLYWLCKNNEAALFFFENGTTNLKCRILFDNFNFNLVNKEKRIIPLSDSLFLVSTMQGILMINTRKLIESHLPQNEKLIVTGFEYINLKGKHAIPLDQKEITLSHDVNEFKVNVATTAYAQNKQISYKIEGISSDWSSWQKDGTITILKLPAGNYILKIRKYTVKGPFPELSIQIKVLTPWYLTFWAYLLYCFLIFCTIGLGIFSYMNKLRQKEIRSAEAEKRLEKEKLQQYKNQALEAELQNKKNELSLQTTVLLKKNESIQILLNELDHQKEILSDRYPQKLYSRMRMLMESYINDKESWLLFESAFNSAHQNFTDRLRSQYTELTPGDLRICCLLRMNLATKEIASLLNISIRAIELRRYRLRKKLQLDNNENLIDFLQRY